MSVRVLTAPEGTCVIHLSGRVPAPSSGGVGSGSKLSRLPGWLIWMTATWPPPTPLCTLTHTQTSFPSARHFRLIGLATATAGWGLRPGQIQCVRICVCCCEGTGQSLWHLSPKHNPCPLKLGGWAEPGPPLGPRTPAPKQSWADEFSGLAGACWGQLGGNEGWEWELRGAVNRCSKQMWGYSFCLKRDTLKPANDRESQIKTRSASPAAFGGKWMSWKQLVWISVLLMVLMTHEGEKGLTNLHDHLQTDINRHAEILALGSEGRTQLSAPSTRLMTLFSADICLCGRGWSRLPSEPPGLGKSWLSSEFYHCKILK